MSNTLSNALQICYNHGYRAYNSFYECYYLLTDLYFLDPFFKKGINIPVTDSMSTSWDYEGLNKDEEKQLNNLLDNLEFKRVLTSCLTSESLYGGCAMYINTYGKKASDPLLENDEINEVCEVGRIDITKTYTAFDPLCKDLEKIEYLEVNSKPVHISRMLIFRGKVSPIASTYQRYNAYTNTGLFSVPHSISVINSIIEAAKVRNNTIEVSERSSAWLLKTKDLEIDVESGVARQEQTIEKFRGFKNTKLCNISTEDDLTAINSGGFGDFIALQQKQLETLSIAFDIPLSRYGVDSASTFQNSGATERSSWFDVVRSIQEFHIRPIITKIINHLAKQINITKEFTIVFKALEQPSPQQVAQINTEYTNILVSLVDSGVISTDEARKEAAAKGILSVTDISTPAPQVQYDDQDIVSQRLAQQKLFNENLEELRGINGTSLKEQ